MTNPAYGDPAPAEWRQAYAILTPYIRSHLADLEAPVPGKPGVPYYAKGWELAFALLDARAEEAAQAGAVDQDARISKACIELALRFFLRRALLIQGGRHDAAWLKRMLRSYGQRLHTARQRLPDPCAAADQIVYETLMSEAHKLLRRARH